MLMKGGKFQKQKGLCTDIKCMTHSAIDFRLPLQAPVRMSFFQLSSLVILRKYVWETPRPQLQMIHWVFNGCNCRVGWERVVCGFSLDKHEASSTTSSNNTWTPSRLTSLCCFPFSMISVKRILVGHFDVGHLSKTSCATNKMHVIWHPVLIYDPTCEVFAFEESNYGTETCDVGKVVREVSIEIWHLKFSPLQEQLP